MSANDRPRAHAGAGPGELREDAPLTWGGETDRGACGGPRFIAGCFGALSVAITVALVAQICYGDFQVAAHGSVASSAEACSRAGTDALRAGGGALDAAATAALCLAVVAPHRTGLDASGSLMLWEYRHARTKPPFVALWGGAPADGTERAPRLLAALAWLHARYGRLPWGRLLQPAIDLASNGFPVSSELAASERLVAERPLGDLTKNAILALPKLASYLATLQQNTSRELANAWAPRVNEVPARTIRLGRWTLQLPSALHTSDAVLEAVTPLYAAEPTADNELRPDSIVVRLASVLRRLQAADSWPPDSAATGLAVIDNQDVYASLVTGLSGWLGSRRLTAGAWLDDSAGAAPPPPAMLVENAVCGRRYVMGAGGVAALAQVVAALTFTETGGLSAAVEQPRVQPLPQGTLGLEAPAPDSLVAALAKQGTLSNISEPYPSVNVVQQTGDSLASHADSRGGGLASRFQ